MTDNKTIDKIRAILRKAEEGHNPSDAERAVAMQMAQKLLLKHGLSMADIGDLETDEQRFVHEGLMTTDGDLDYWRGQLLARLASVYFCKSYRIPFGGRSNRWVVIGRDINVQMCQAMFDFIVPQIEREVTTSLASMNQCRRYAFLYAREVFKLEAPADMEFDLEEAAEFARVRIEGLKGGAALEDIMERTAAAPETNYEGIAKAYASEVRPYIKRCDLAPTFTKNVGVWRRSFCEAAVNRVYNRLMSMRREEVKDAGDPGTALVKNEAANLKAFLDELNLGLQSSGSEREHDFHGAESGDAAGKRADLSGHRKMGGTRKELSS